MNKPRPAYRALYFTAKWRTLRLNQLSKAPLCAYCLAQGLTVAATVADHIRPHRGYINLFSNPDNLQSLCKRCHDSHKQRQEKGGALPGADITGAPLDPLSHWNK